MTETAGASVLPEQTLYGQPVYAAEEAHTPDTEILEKVWCHLSQAWIEIPREEIVPEGTKWGWSSTRLWFKFCAVVTPLDPTPSEDAWGSWIPGSGDSRYGGWGKGGNSYSYRDKPRDGDVPEWDGKKEHRSIYFRKIDLWRSTTGVDLINQAPRLLQKLEGDAFDKLENIEPLTLRVPNGVEIFKKAIEDAYELIEDYRVGKIMDEFLDDFSRKRGEEIVDYHRRWEKEVRKAEKVAGEITGKWKAHLYMKKMRITTLMVSQLLTSTHGEYSVDALSRAALKTYPNIKGAFAKGSAGSGAYKSEHKHKDRSYKGKKSFKGKRFHRKSHRAHEVDAEGNALSGETDSEQSETEEVFHSKEGDTESEESDTDEDEDAEVHQTQTGEDGVRTTEPSPGVPEELESAYQEACAYLTRAKKQRREVEKARGFFRKDPGSSKDHVDKLKQKHPCSRCGSLGHWYKDPQCPKNKGKPPDNKGSKSHGKSPHKKKTYMLTHDVHVLSVDDVEIPYPSLVDTACAKSVTGETDALALLDFAKESGWTILKVEDREPFRFGPGNRVWSDYALIVVTMWAGMTVVVRISVIKQKVPCLLSKYVN